MTRVSLATGAYQSRSVIANAQRSVNLFAEKNAQDSPSPYTHYSVPGSVAFGESLNQPARGLYWANSDELYYVCGNGVYLVDANGVYRGLGYIYTASGPVSMADNGTSLVLVDGTFRGYEIDLVSHVMTPIGDPTNAPPSAGGGVYAFYGATRIDATDGYLVLNQPGTRNFYTTYNNEIVFDALYFAAKNGYSDNLVTLIVTRREIWLLGERTTEIWFNSGAADFPFQILPGPFIPHGCAAAYSVAQVNGAIFWLTQDQSGSRIIMRGEGYAAERISNHAMESEMAGYARIDDAIGFCFQMEGHAFYQINFPTADKTWRWDEATPGFWHEAVWTDPNGGEHRHRGVCHAFAYGKNIVGDWETGQLYILDMNVHTDNGAPMYFRRGYPHMMNDGKRVIYPGFILDVEAGTSPNTVAIPGPFPYLAPGPIYPEPIDTSNGDAIMVSPAPPAELVASPIVNLRWSDDRGRTFGNPVPQSLGSTGEYRVQPQWSRLGLARDRVFEIFGVIPGRLAINGAFLDPPPIVMGS